MRLQPDDRLHNHRPCDLIIRRNCHSAMREHGRLQAVEEILSPDKRAVSGKVFAHGASAPYRRAGAYRGQISQVIHLRRFRLTWVIPTPGLQSVIEALPVGRGAANLLMNTKCVLEGIHPNSY
jgi:hypothetical protein